IVPQVRLYDTADEARHAHGQVERIGLSGTRLVHRASRGEITRELPQGGVADAFAAMVEALTSKEVGIIGDRGEVSVVVHRVERFTEATVISDDVVAQIEGVVLISRRS